MTSLSAPEAQAVVAAYDFSPFRSVLDVGAPEVPFDLRSRMP